MIGSPDFRACSSAWLERTPDKREVDGSTPSRPTTFWGCSSVGRAPALHAGGHRFEPVHLHHFNLEHCFEPGGRGGWSSVFFLFFDNSDVNENVSFFNQMLSMFVSIILWPSY